jgi:hypothetical protein
VTEEAAKSAIDFIFLDKSHSSTAEHNPLSEAEEGPLPEITISASQLQA